MWFSLSPLLPPTLSPCIERLISSPHYFTVSPLYSLSHAHGLSLELQGKVHSSTLLPFSFCFPPIFGLSCVSPHPLSSSLFGPWCAEHLSCCCFSELLLLLNSHFQSMPHYLHRLFVLNLIVAFLHAFTSELFTCLCCWKSSLAPFQWHPSFAPSGLGPCAKLV